MTRENIEKRIEVRNVSKTFSVGSRGAETALGRLVRMFSGREQKKPMKVLDNIGFDVCAGENIGVIGRNGSGKSTLLRVIAGIYRADSGSVTTKGTVMYMNGFNHGLRQKLTMRENIYLMGAIMGLRESEVEEKFENIVQLSGLREFLDTKVYQFSSGMITRLTFSVSIHCLHARNPDILLLDEVITAGGDADFRARAADKIREFIRGGATVVMVSHNIRDIEEYCTRAILLEKGKVVKIGDTREVIELYK